MGDDIEINVTETTNIIEITPQPNDQIVDIAVTDNAPNVEINVTPSVVEINVTRGSSTAIWGSIEGNLTDQSDLVTALGLKADLIDGKVPSTQLPSYVDDVIEVANYAALPTSGEIGKIYVTLDNNKIYRWSGSIYIEIAANQAIWGAITGNLGDQLDLQNALNTKEPTITAGTTSQYWRGDKSWQTLDKNAVGLGNVDNTSDLNKPISTATQTALNGKFNNPTGDTTQYIAGDGSLITFPISGQAGTIVREVRNTTGATLTKGTIVYISGATGNKATISKAIATGDSTSAQTFGLLQADISNNANGYVVVLGDLIGLDTSGITEGSQLYLSSTVAGAYTTTKQVAPAHLVYIGVVTRSHPTLGQIEVKIQNGYELDEIHDVLITSKANNQFLVYESASTLWKNKSLSTILGGTSSQFLKGDGSLDSTAYVPTARTLTINGTAYDLSANRSWTITAGVWGQITGILSNQTDLQTALDAKTPTARTLTINGTAYDLSANRSWTIPTHDAVTIGTANGLSLSTQVLSLGLSSASTNGALSSTDWTTFNNKQGALTFTSPLVNTSGTVSIPAATGSVNGYLTSTDWTTFNNKQGALNGTGFVKISGTTISYDNSTYALDSVVVKLSGSQTIADTKTFSGTPNFDNNIYLKKTGSWANPANYSVIGGMTHGFFLSSGTNKHAYLDLFALTQARQFSFPNQSGTFAMTTDVPTVSGDANYISKFTGANTLGNSPIYDYSGKIGIGTLLPSQKLTVDGGTTDPAPIFAKSSLLYSGKYYSGILAGYNTNINQSVQFGYIYDSTTAANSIAHITAYGTVEGSQFSMRANGNVGIGITTDAGYKLDVNGTGRFSGELQATRFFSIGSLNNTNGSFLIDHPGVQTWKIGITNSNTSTFSIGNDNGGSFASKIFNIASGGDVGIGTLNNYSSKLSVLISDATSTLAGVKTSLRLMNDGSGRIAKLLFTDNTISDATICFIPAGGGNSTLSFGIQGTTVNYQTLNIKENGRVGINTDSPSAILQANGSNSNGVIQAYVTAGGGSALRLNTNFVNNNYIDLNPYVTGVSNNGFEINQNGTQRFVISGDGNVGIGTTSPTYKFEVSDGTRTGVINPNSSLDGIFIGVTQAKPLIFGTTNTERMRITSGGDVQVVGNVGIGTTSPTYKFEVSDGTRTGVINPNSALDGIFIGVKEAKPLVFGTGDTERMRIFSSGNVFIGSSPSDAGYKLDVNGSGRFYANGQILSLKSTTNNGSYIEFEHNSGGSYSYIGNAYHLLASPYNVNTDFAIRAQGALYLTTGGYTPRLTIASTGAATFSSTVTATGFFNSSDNRLKEIVDYDYSVSDIKPMNYYWKDKRDDKKHVGYSAQEVQKVMPDAVNEDEDGMLSVNYIEVLVAKIAQMENRIKQLENGLE